MPDEVDRPGQYDERYEVRQAEIEQLLYRFGRLFGDDLPEGWGFALFLFSYGDNGSMFYISSGQRADVIRMLKEYLAREERKP